MDKIFITGCIGDTPLQPSFSSHFQPPQQTTRKIETGAVVESRGRGPFPVAAKAIHIAVPMTSTAMTATSYSDIVAGDVSSRSLNSDNAFRQELFTPPPTSVTLVAALMLLDTPLAPRPSRTPDGSLVIPRNDEYVFLLTRKYLQNWLCWAYHQPVSREESERVKRALQMAASIHKLTPPTESSTYEEPGPIDSTQLSVLGHPLLLRPHVIVGRTENGDNFSPDVAGGDPLEKSQSVSNLLPAAAEKDAGDGSKQPPAPEDGGYVGCCAVPERFYEV